MSKNKRILITGGCGFIGSHFIRSVLERPDVTVLNVDMLTYAGNKENLNDVEKSSGERYRHVVADICDVDAMQEIINEFNPDIVVHFAAESHVDRSYFDAYDFIKTNIEGTRVLLEVVRRKGGIRFLHISTDEIYGDIEDGELSTEDSPFRPSNLYAASKAGADLLVQSFIRTYSFPAMIVRGSNNYGTHQYPEKLIPMVITNILENRPISLHGDGSHRRAWLHVKDFCSAIRLVMDKAEDGTIWNVSGENRTNKQVLETVAKVLNTSLDGRIISVPDRPGADFRYAVSADKLKNVLGWSPQFTFDNDIKDIVQWYIDNQDWWTKLRASDEFVEHYKKQSDGKWF
jgi:dTDP-glucose 4,6-dehydratase